MNNQSWKKGMKVSYNGIKATVSHVFPDGSADIIDSKTHKLLGKIAKPFTPNLSIDATNPDLTNVDVDRRSLTVKDFNALMDANEEYFDMVERYESLKDTHEGEKLQQVLKFKEEEISILEKKMFN
jgi:hypothetical protein